MRTSGYGILLNDIKAMKTATLKEDGEGLDFDATNNHVNVTPNEYTHNRWDTETPKNFNPAIVVSNAIINHIPENDKIVYKDSPRQFSAIIKNSPVDNTALHTNVINHLQKEFAKINPIGYDKDNNVGPVEKMGVNPQEITPSVGWDAASKSTLQNKFHMGTYQPSVVVHSKKETNPFTGQESFTHHIDVQQYH